MEFIKSCLNKYNNHIDYFYHQKTFSPLHLVLSCLSLILGQPVVSVPGDCANIDVLFCLCLRYFFFLRFVS